MRYFVGTVRQAGLLLVLILSSAAGALGQFETATVLGRVSDPTGLSVSGAQVNLVDIDRGTALSTTTDSSGVYRFTTIHPGRYRMEIRATGFRVVNLTDLTVNVQDHLEQNFRLSLGSVAESITVAGGAPLVNTESPTVSTVVDRNFAENLPLNGRSFQTLIELTPGVVPTANNGVDTGQFSVNGQRASSNYWMVDGVGANVGINATGSPGSGAAGTLGATSVFGGTNSLVSVDALQEFRIQTSTYSPEFGRAPGAQISIVTRSGTNQFHGTAFDYLRNDVFDANNWFNGYTNNPPLPKAKERQNDFGGTFSGPILKGKTFFFFSYEGLRLRLPQTTLTLVPDSNPQDPYSRQFAIPPLVPYLNAFPLANGPEVLDGNGNHQGIAQFNASYSNPGSLDAYSLRIDHKLTDNLSLFGRYDYSPSKLIQRGGLGFALNTVLPTAATTQTGTLGVTWAISPTAVDDLRFNYSNTSGSTSSHLDGFGGAIPLGTLPFPSSYTTRNAEFQFAVSALGTNNDAFLEGAGGNNRQRQFNILNSVSIQKGPHGLKFGVDYRRLSPRSASASYVQEPFFLDMPSAGTGNMSYSLVQSALPVTLLFRDFAAFAQDNWQLGRRLTMTYGLRWDVNFVPSTLSGPGFNALTGFNLRDLSNLALLPRRIPPYQTKWGNLAPRVGWAYQLSQNERWQTVLRGGFGVFYDLATSEAGNTIGLQSYPFGSLAEIVGPVFGGTSTFPLSPTDASPPPIVPPNANCCSVLSGFDPALRLPYTLQWNFAIEQALGKQQTVSASYIGAAGRRLIQTASISFPNPNLFGADLITNAGNSDYDALQLQFQRRLSRGLQLLASYSWSHSLDTASAGSTASGSNALAAQNGNINRGPSDFDVRNAFSIALTYEIPVPDLSAFAREILHGWSTENIVQVRSAPPVDVFFGGFTQLSNGFLASVRPDIVPGQPFYLYGPQYPGGKALNPAAFTSPALAPPGCDPLTTYPCFPANQGDLPRNSLRTFGLSQWDFAVHREFILHESLKLQFRAEMFNVLNHPNFGPPVGNLGYPGLLNPQFGISTQMLGRSLAGVSGSGTGAFDPLYQLGGPRSIQFGLKLSF